MVLITEISEEDFRKLDLTVWSRENGNTWTPRKINDILDEQIQYALYAGYQENLIELSVPVTIAIHISNNSDKKIGYWDKFMNRFSPESTYEIGWGIKHLYSTRDYYECKSDYWRVRKNETKVVYRVHLSSKYQKQFILKHKSVLIGDNIYGNYDLVDGEWVLRNKTKITETEYSTIYEPYQES